MLNRNASRFVIGLVIAVGLPGLSACSREEIDLTTPGDGAPALPSLSTMTMDVSFFGIEDLDAAAAKERDTDAMLASAGNKTNWINAVVRVIYIQLTLYDALEEPVGAFAYAIHSVPQEVEEGVYLWPYIFVDDGIEYSVFLYGQIEEDHVKWRMEVSSNNPELMLDHFVWFDGESKLDDSGGFWQFYAPVLGGAVNASSGMSGQTPGVPVFRIDYENISYYESRLTILNNEVGGEDEGDMIVFHETRTVNTIDFHDADLMEDSNITWFADNSGSITVPDYNNGETACWDTNLNDTTCP